MNNSVSCGILEPTFCGANLIFDYEGALGPSASFNTERPPFEGAFRSSITCAGGDSLPTPAASSGHNPPPAAGIPTQALGDPPQRVFLRLPGRHSPGPLDGTPLKNRKLHRMISPGPWNKNSPPIRAYVLRKTGTDRGIVLIENEDVLRYWNECFRWSGIFTAPIPVPTIALPPVLHIPPPGKECPYTSLKHTTMFELSRPFSPYGQTQIYVARYLLPGSAAKVIAIETQSLLRYIRSLPPPKYKISSRNPAFFQKLRQPTSPPGGASTVN
jgi:hypothetical protein